MKKNNKIAFLIASATIASQLVSTGFISNAQAPETDSTYIVNNQKESYQNEIKLSGTGYSLGTQSFTLKFDKQHNKLIATDIRFPNNAMHPGFGNSKYIELQLIGRNGEVKDTFSMTGNNKIDIVQKINDSNRFKFEIGDYLKIYHAEADWRTTISGTVQDASLNSNYNQRVSGDILNNYIFEITESGLKQVRESSLKDTKTYKNEIQLLGLGYQPGYQSFKLSFDTKYQKLRATELRFPNNAMHTLFPDKYIEFKLIDKNGKIKDTFSMTGHDKVDVVKQINAANRFNFEYGDYLKIYHHEAAGYPWRIKIFGDIQNPSEGTKYNEAIGANILNNCVFKITEDGLKQVKVYPNEIQLLGLGYGPGYQSFKLKFDTENQRIVATDLRFPGNAIHYSFSDKYIGLKLIGKNGNTKAEFSMNGTDKVDIVKEINSKFNFEYGDKLEIYHREADWRTKIFGTVKDNTTGTDFSQKICGNILNKYKFEITENGLKLV